MSTFRIEPTGSQLGLVTAQSLLVLQALPILAASPAVQVETEDILPAY